MRDISSKHKSSLWPACWSDTVKVTACHTGIQENWSTPWHRCADHRRIGGPLEGLAMQRGCRRFQRNPKQGLLLAIKSTICVRPPLRKIRLTAANVNRLRRRLPCHSSTISRNFMDVSLRKNCWTRHIIVRDRTLQKSYWFKAVVEQGKQL